MKRIIFLLTLVLISTLAFTEGTFRGYKDIQCRLKVQKTSYRIGDPILVHFQVRNKGLSPVKIKLSKKSFNNFSFSVKSIKNKIVNEKEEFFLKKMSARETTQIAKTITLDTQQFYGESFDLSKDYELDKPGHYIIEGIFYPVPGRESTQISTQVIQIEIRESLTQEQGSLKEKNIEVRELAKPRNPYNTIQFMLQGRIDRKWNRYFRYLDLHEIIKQYPKFYKRYLALKPSKRKPVVQDFKQYLKEYLSEIGLGRLHGFTIYKSVVENQKKKAKIYVNIIYKTAEMNFSRKYVYYLYQQNRRWYVDNWKVENR